MTHKLLSTLIGVGLVALVMGCGGKYSDLKEANQEFIKLMSAYVDAMAEVGNAKDAAKAINNLADGMEKLAPQMKALKDKYPELQDPEKMPEELKMSEKEMEEIGQKFGQSFMKLIPYMADPQVQDAQLRLTTIMSSMGEKR